MLDWTKPIQTKTGGPARYLGKLDRAFFPHVVAYSTVSNGEQLVCVDLDGRSTLDGSAVSPWYSVEITNIPVTRTVFLNFYDAGTDCMPICSVHASKELADSVKGGCMNKVACVEVTYTEGEGLSNGS